MKNLHIELRPKSLDEVIGNKKTKEILSKFISNKSTPNVLLFKGESGCGKTTLARIIAENLTEKGYIHEMNSASYRGIDSVRDLEKAFASSNGLLDNVNVIILDEVHQLTKPAQDALLKFTEEASSYNYYVFLLTTDESSLVKALQNRATHIEVGPLNDDEATDFLENKVFLAWQNKPNKLIKSIIKASNNTPRKMLTMAEAVVGFIDDEDKALESLPNILLENNKEMIDLVRFLVKNFRNKSQYTPFLEQYNDFLKLVEPNSFMFVIAGYINSLMTNSNANMRDRAFLMNDIVIRNFGYTLPKNRMMMIIFEMFNT